MYCSPSWRGSAQTIQPSSVRQDCGNDSSYREANSAQHQWCNRLMFLPIFQRWQKLKNYGCEWLVREKLMSHRVFICTGSIYILYKTEGNLLYFQLTVFPADYFQIFAKIMMALLMARLVTDGHLEKR